MYKSHENNDLHWERYESGGLFKGVIYNGGIDEQSRELLLARFVSEWVYNQYKSITYNHFFND